MLTFVKLVDLKLFYFKLIKMTDFLKKKKSNAFT